MRCLYWELDKKLSTSLELNEVSEYLWWEVEGNQRLTLIWCCCEVLLREATACVHVGTSYASFAAYASLAQW